MCLDHAYFKDRANNERVVGGVIRGERTVLTVETHDKPALATVDAIVLEDPIRVVSRERDCARLDAGSRSRCQRRQEGLRRASQLGRRGRRA